MQFGPLGQFDLNILSPSGSFEVEIFPKDNFTFIIFSLISFLIFQQVWEYFAENLTVYMIDFNFENLLKDLTKKVNQNWIDSGLTVFTVIFCCNMAGLLPWTQTITAQIVCTLFLSLQTIVTIQLQSFIQLKIAAFNHFMPAGTPLALAPFIISIELISNLSRIVSLAVRLFANMTSGHALLKILAGFGLLALNLSASWKVLIFLPALIIVIITFLELLIAGLQTYVFVTLIMIYVSEFEIMITKRISTISKLFSILELQLNVVLLQSQLAISRSLINQIVFYNCIKVNQRTIISGYYVCKLFDIILLPQQLFVLQNLQFRKQRMFISSQMQPQTHFLISPTVGVIIIVGEPHLFFNSILIKNKIKNRVSLSTPFSKTHFKVQGLLGILRLSIAQMLQLFKQ